VVCGVFAGVLVVVCCGWFIVFWFVLFVVLVVGVCWFVEFGLCFVVFFL